MASTAEQYYTEHGGINGVYCERCQHTYSLSFHEFKVLHWDAHLCPPRAWRQHMPRNLNDLSAWPYHTPTRGEETCDGSVQFDDDVEGGFAEPRSSDSSPMNDMHGHGMENNVLHASHSHDLLEGGVYGEDPEQFWEAAEIDEDTCSQASSEGYDSIDEDAFQQAWNGMGVIEDNQEEEQEEVEEEVGVHEHGSVKYFLERMDEEVYDGAGQSLRQWLITRVSEKLTYNTTDSAFEGFLKREYMELTHFQGKLNVHIPTSIYMVRKLLDVKDLWEVEYHVCACEGHVWRPMAPISWRAPGQEGCSGFQYQCPECDSYRFELHTEANGKAKVVPKLKCYYFGVYSGFLRPNFQQQDFCTKLGSDRNMSTPGSFWCSPEYQRLDSILAGQLSQAAPSTSALRYKMIPVLIGFDYVGLYESRNRSTGVLCMKCDDLPPIESSARKFHRILMIIPPLRNSDGSTRAAKKVNSYLLPLLQDLQRIGPAYTQGDVQSFCGVLGSVPPSEIGQGVLVTPTISDANGKPTSAPPIRCHVVCTGFHADAPARAALMNSLPLTSYLGCLYCMMSQICVSAGRRLFMGYASAVTIARGRLQGQRKQMVVDDASLKWTSAQQVNRGRAAENAESNIHGFLGVHGECKIQKLLWYMDFNRICFTPFVHCFYRGVFRDWMLSICATIPYLRDNVKGFPIIGKAPFGLRPQHALTNSQRKEIERRMGNMVFTNEFGRLPESPIAYGKQQVMEQLIRLLDCVFPLLFADVLNDTSIRLCPIKKSFGHLRRFADQHMRVHNYLPHEEHLRRTHLEAARNELLEYAKMAEQVSSHGL